MSETIQVRIEKLVYGGEGLGHVEGQAVLVPLVVPGELVEAEVVKRQPRLVRARLERVLEPSPERSQPGCPHFGKCGGCQYQQMDYPRQLCEKSSILRETLVRLGKLNAPEPDLIPSEPWNYRNRARFRFEKTEQDFRLGYFEMASHRLLPIKECPISSPRINGLVSQLYDLGKRPDFAAGHGEIEAFVNQDDTELLLTVTTEQRWPETLVSAAREIVPGLASLAVAQPSAPAGGSRRSGRRAPEEPTLCWMRRKKRGTSSKEWGTRWKPASGRGGAETRAKTGAGNPDGYPSGWTPALHMRTYGRGHLLYRAAGIDFRVSHGSFFQINRFLVERMAEAAIEGLQGQVAFDLFSGVGYFALPLARRFARVVAVESNRFAVHDLDSNRVRAAASNIEVIQAGAEEFLQGRPSPPFAGSNPQKPRIASGKEWGTQAPKPDVVLLDPPRAGLGQHGSERLASLGAHTIVYVSCDPATLARDLAVLTNRGYQLKSLKLLDLFPQTFHLETIARLTR